MRNILFLSLALFLFSECSNDTNNKELLPEDSLVGEWQLVEQNVSIGGPSTWEAVENGKKFRLNADDTFKGISLQSECDTGTFEATEEELILSYNCPEYSKPFTYSLDREEADIIISPKTVICFEACEYKYRKIGQ